jgi:hypothetical protein
VALGAARRVADVARNLERWVSAVVIRTFSAGRAGSRRAARRLPRDAPPITGIRASNRRLPTLQERFGQLRGRTITVGRRQQRSRRHRPRRGDPGCTFRIAGGGQRNCRRRRPAGDQRGATARLRLFSDG